MADMTEEQWKKHDLFFCGGHDMPPTKVPRHVAMELFRYAQALRKERYNRVCECGGVVFGSADHKCDKCGSLESVECLAIEYCKLRGEVERLKEDCGDHNSHIGPDKPEET